MTKRYDVLSPRPRKDSDKPYWHRVGTAWEGERGISIVFDSIPLPDATGIVRVSLFEPREKDGATMPKAKMADVQGGARSQQREMDDEIPF